MNVPCLVFWGTGQSPPNVRVATLPKTRCGPAPILPFLEDLVVRDVDHIASRALSCHHACHELRPAHSIGFCVLCVVCCVVLWCCGVVVLWCCGVVVLWCVAVCCGVLRCVVVCCGVLWCVVVCCGVLWCVVVCCGVLWCVVVCCGVLWCVVVCCGVLCCVVLCLLCCVVLCCVVLCCVV